MKRVLLALAIVGLCAGSAMAINYPTLTPYPSYIPMLGCPWVQTGAGTAASTLYTKDVTGGMLPMMLGLANPDPTLNNNYILTADVTFDVVTELGLIARGDVNNGKTYELSVDTTNGYFNLVKITTTSTFVNLMTLPTFAGSGALLGQTVSMDWKVETIGSDVHLLGHVYQGGELKNTIDYLDNGSKGGSPYLSGSIGTYSIKKNVAVEGHWSNLTVNAIPEPGSIAMLVAGVLGLLGWAGLRRR
jgi:hypothetical protein